MKFILFIHKASSRKGDVLKSIIEENFNNVEIQIFQTFDLFKARLRQVSIYNDEIYVLLADSKNRMEKLTLFIDLLKDRRIILILPDDSKAVISIAHHFFPRFVTYMNDTYVDLCEVLKKMISLKK
ncbi:hypothetical protein [Desulfobacula phenolica]|uniref:Uncharacterized protein n=1 Tax=Desulfobacula phenolica TaxID=90732 RepID=A0A1H2DP57_9BACT|nr:hypothetical protein [Desulfobacula phenolica]SDT84148.1 hypothetical protein SAMN04487931_101139 [Desulfobacula phenolica]